MHGYMHDRGGLRRPGRGLQIQEKPNTGKGKPAGNARRHRIKTRNTDPSVTFTGMPVTLPESAVTFTGIRNGSFEPQIVTKHQTRWSGFDDKILSLYARGMTVREIQSHLQEMYGAEVSPTLISSVTDAVMDEVKAWQARPLDALYPIVYLDCIHVKVRDSGAVRVKAVYLAIGHQHGRREGNAGPVDRPDRRCQVLAAGGHRTEEPWRAGHLHRLRGWPQGLSRCH